MFRRISQASLAACLLAASVCPSLAQQGPPAPIAFDTGVLTVESDFTVFMRAHVPDDVRRAALRRLWSLMRLPVSCNDLCYEPEPAASSLARLASEAASVTAAGIASSRAN